jgi:hypothetical protein
MGINASGLIMAALYALAMGQAPLLGADDDAARKPATVPTTRPASVLEVLEPIREKLPAGKDWTAEPVDTADKGDLGALYAWFPWEQQKQLRAATVRLVGYSGSGAQQESVSLTVIEFSDEELAKEMPASFDERFRGLVPILRRGGLDVKKLEIAPAKEVQAETASSLTATGTNTDAGKPFRIVQIRATHGKRMVELAVRDMDMPRERMVDVVNQVLTGLRGLDASTPRR